MKMLFSTSSWLFIDFVIPWLLLCSVSKAALVNVTIDDTFPDPVHGSMITYTPQAAWINGTTCTKTQSSCTGSPDPSQLKDGTWHEGAFSSAVQSKYILASTSFNGSAVYIYCVLGRTTSNATTPANMSVSLDGYLMSTSVQQPPSQPGYSYNVPVYTNTSLSPGPHLLSLQISNLGNDSFVLLDYIIYTYDNSDDPLSSSSQSHLPVIIGAAVGGVAVVGLIVALTLFFCRRRRRAEVAHHPKQQPFKPYEPFPEYPNTALASRVGLTDDQRTTTTGIASSTQLARHATATTTAPSQFGDSESVSTAHFSPPTLSNLHLIGPHGRQPSIKNSISATYRSESPERLHHYHDPDPFRSAPSHRSVGPAPSTISSSSNPTMAPSTISNSTSRPLLSYHNRQQSSTTASGSQITDLSDPRNYHHVYDDHDPWNTYPPRELSPDGPPPAYYKEPENESVAQPQIADSKVTLGFNAHGRI